MTEKREWFITGAGRGMVNNAAKFSGGYFEELTPAQNEDPLATGLVGPGFFRTDLLTKESAAYATPSIRDYADRHAERVQWYESMNGRQEGDPAKLAQALVTIAGPERPPRRFIALGGIIEVAEQKAKDPHEQANAHRELSTSLVSDVA
jgi:hypothetical protein